MAHFSITPSIISSLVLLFLLYAASSSASKVMDVKVIDAQARYPKLCLSVLKSEPGGAKRADLIILAQYPINAAHVKANNTVNQTNMLIPKSDSDHKAKAHYKIFLTHFNKNESALNDINYVQELLNKGNYFRVSITTGNVLTNVDDCLTGENPKGTPYANKFKLPQYPDVLNKLLRIFFVLRKYFEKVHVYLEVGHLIHIVYEIVNLVLILTIDVELIEIVIVFA
ncbi:hypothetical protein Lal_00045669 [Lupinus albus]|uniref:Putative pectinesterase inhibitor domain-containing protein n=1 Tax=Lupinus albus TaxID=3870 RepID=A0A6A5NK35_LUPAL|nr:putative pectinesterase inhibitor domain-containing protein [Lupinus albus]KAF1886437.1 hypothetical protein Lal_00045669 [Lupinus albus]